MGSYKGIDRSFTVGAPATAGDAVDLKMKADIAKGKLHTQPVTLIKGCPEPSHEPRRWVIGPMPWDVLLDVVRLSLERDGRARCAKAWGDRPGYQSVIDHLTAPVSFDDVEF